ncbi:hypothetical protein KA107_02240 [Candidatus Pacearchaeota archaeon]|nr:hypothetical protein [Candidatus Pacearchaeota archaeon]
MDIAEIVSKVLVPSSSGELPPMPSQYHEQFHRECLTKLKQSLWLIGEKPTKLRYIVADTIWRPRGYRDVVKMPDIIAVRQDNSALIAELKHSDVHRDQALSQMLNGERFALEELGIFKCDLKLVLYSNSGKYTYDTIERLSP